MATRAYFLSKGLPFFMFMVAGTYTLSLYIQIRNDYVDKDKRVVAADKQLNAKDPLTLEDELQEIQGKLGDTSDYSMVKTNVKLD